MIQQGFSFLIIYINQFYIHCISCASVHVTVVYSKTNKQKGKMYDDFRYEKKNKAPFEF